MCGCRVDSCGQGVLVADALAALDRTLPSLAASANVAGIDVGMINSGAIGATLAVGWVSRLSLLELVPYTNEVVLLTMSGATLRAALQNGLWGLSLQDASTNPEGRLLQLSSQVSLSWYYSGATPVLSSVMISGAPLDDTKSYKVATNDFVANGGDGFTMFAVDGVPSAGVVARRLGVTTFDALVAYVSPAAAVTTLNVEPGK